MAKPLKKLGTRLISKYSFFQWLYTTFFSKKKKDFLLRTMMELKNLEKYSMAEMRDYHEAKLKEMLLHAHRTTQYYRELFDENDIDYTDLSDFKNIPFLTKEIIRDNTKSMLSTKYKFKNLSRRFTGGSTGEPLEFYSDKFAPEIDNAHHWYLYSLMGYKKKDIIVNIAGKILPDNLIRENIFWTKNLRGFVFGDYTFSSLYINETNIAIYINKFLSLKPSIVRGYPSAVNQLAIYIIENHIAMDFQIKGINLSSELCTEIQKDNIEKAFKSKIYFEYGNKELNVFCYTKGKSYHYESSPLYCYLEVLDEDGKNTELGKIGRIVATGLCNRGMPFIRYETGDLGEISARNGGVVTFKRILGRVQDYLIDKNGKKVYLIGSIYTYKLKAFKKIKIWQLQQSKKGKVTVLIVPGQYFSEDDKLQIQDFFGSFNNLQFDFNYVENIPKTKIGKHLFVKQNIKT